MNDKAQFTDGDMFAAMCKSMNESLNIDPIFVKEINGHEELEEPIKWNGAYQDFNGLDVKNIKNPIFDK